MLVFLKVEKLVNLVTFACFIDFSKAYDRIPRSLLWYKLSKIGVNGNILRAFQALYTNVKCQVRVNDMVSNSFDVSSGLKQGCLASCLLFNVYINDLITAINKLDRGVKVGSRKVSLLIYADDIVLLGNCASDIQCMLGVLNQWCVDWGLQVNPTKSKIIHFRNKGITPINIAGNIARYNINIQFLCASVFVGGGYFIHSAKKLRKLR